MDLVSLLVLWAGCLMYIFPPAEAQDPAACHLGRLVAPSVTQYYGGQVLLLHTIPERLSGSRLVGFQMQAETTTGEVYIQLWRPPPNTVTGYPVPFEASLVEMWEMDKMTIGLHPYSMSSPAGANCPYLVPGDRLGVYMPPDSYVVPQGGSNTPYPPRPSVIPPSKPQRNDKLSFAWSSQTSGFELAIRFFITTGACSTTLPQTNYSCTNPPPPVTHTGSSTAIQTTVSVTTVWPDQTSAGDQLKERRDMGAEGAAGAAVPVWVYPAVAVPCVALLAIVAGLIYAKSSCCRSKQKKNPLPAADELTEQKRDSGVYEQIDENYDFHKNVTRTDETDGYVNPMSPHYEGLAGVRRVEAPPGEGHQGGEREHRGSKTRGKEQWSLGEKQRSRDENQGHRGERQGSRDDYRGSERERQGRRTIDYQGSEEERQGTRDERPDSEDADYLEMVGYGPGNVGSEGSGGMRTGNGGREGKKSYIVAREIQGPKRVGSGGSGGGRLGSGESGDRRLGSEESEDRRLGSGESGGRRLGSEEREGRRLGIADRGPRSGGNGGRRLGSEGSGGRGPGSGGSRDTRLGSEDRGPGRGGRGPGSLDSGGRVPRNAGGGGGGSRGDFEERRVKHTKDYLDLF